MFGSRIVLVLMVAASLFGGCASRADSAVEATTAAFSHLADRLAQVTTRDELAGARPDIAEIGEELQAAMSRMRSVGQQSETDKRALAKKHGPDLTAARTRAAGQVKRISDTIDPNAKDRITQMLGIR